MRGAIVGFGAVATVCHLFLAGEHGHNPALTGLMLAMAVACVPCLISLWRHPSGRALHMVLGMSIAMVLVHALWLMLPLGAHSHLAATGEAVADMPLFMLFTLALELVIAALCAVRIRWLRAVAANTSELRASDSDPRGAVTTDGARMCGQCDGRNGATDSLFLSGCSGS